MTTTTQINNINNNELPELDLNLVRQELEQLARDTVDKTLEQARSKGVDPVLGCSSGLATFYVMMPRNDGLAQEKVLDIIATHIKDLVVINEGLKFGIDPKYLKLIESNDPLNMDGIMIDYDPQPQGSTYRPDALIINPHSNKACLLDFKRQTATIETTKLNSIADNLTTASAQVRDFIYKVYKRKAVDLDVRWAIIDCSDQTLSNKFKELGVHGLDSLDEICGVKNVAAAYRLARDFMAKEFSRGETELMLEQQRFIPSKDVAAMIEAAVNQAKLSFTQHLAPEIKDKVTQWVDEPEVISQAHLIEHEEARSQPFPPNVDRSLRRIGMFGI